MGSREEDRLFGMLMGVIYGLIFFGDYKIWAGNSVSMVMMFLQGEIRCYYFIALVDENYSIMFPHEPQNFILFN